MCSHCTHIFVSALAHPNLQSGSPLEFALLLLHINHIHFCVCVCVCACELVILRGTLVQDPKQAELLSGRGPGARVLPSARQALLFLGGLSAEQEDVVCFFTHTHTPPLHKHTPSADKHTPFMWERRGQVWIRAIPLCNTRQHIQYLQPSLSKQSLGTGRVEGWKIPELLLRGFCVCVGVCDPLLYYNDSINAYRPSAWPVLHEGAQEGAVTQPRHGHYVRMTSATDEDELRLRGRA